MTEDALAQLGQRVEEAVRATGSAELSTHDVGLAILGPLQDLDLVAYLRFASVYKAFESLEDFETAISELREVQSLTPGVRGDEAAGECEGADGAREGRGRAAGGEARVLPEVPPPRRRGGETRRRGGPGRDGRAGAKGPPPLPPRTERGAAPRRARPAAGVRPRHTQRLGLDTHRARVIRQAQLPGKNRGMLGRYAPHREAE